MASLEALTSKIESKKAELTKAEEAWDNFAEFLAAHGVDPVTLTSKNFAATRADRFTKNDDAPSVDQKVASSAVTTDDSDDSEEAEVDPIPFDSAAGNNPHEF